MKKLIKYITGIILFSILISTISAADPRFAKIVKKGKYIEYTIVNDYDLGGDASTTKVYNEAEGTTFYDGAVNVAGYENIIYHVDLKTLGSATVTLTFEGKIDDDFTASTGNHMVLYTKAFSATNTGYSFEIQEDNLKWVSVGMVAATPSTDDITIKMRARKKK